MVIGHIPGWLASVGVSSDLGKFVSEWVYSFHMPLFFMLSGYTEGMRPPLEGRQDLFRRLRKNFVSLYLPCMFFSFLQAFLNLAVFSSSNSVNAHIPTLRHFLMIPLSGFLMYWFLCALFFVKSLHAIFDCTIKRKHLHSALWVIFFLISVSGIYEADGGVFGTEISRLWHSTFSLGIYFRLGYVIRYGGYVSRGKSSGLLWGLVLLAAGTAIFFAGGRGFASRMGMALCMSLAMMILFYLFEIGGKFLKFCGLYSMVIYCTHNYAAVIFRIMYRISGLEHSYIPGLPYAVCLAFALFIPLSVV